MIPSIPSPLLHAGGSAQLDQDSWLKVIIGKCSCDVLERGFQPNPVLLADHC